MLLINQFRMSFWHAFDIYHICFYFNCLLAANTDNPETGKKERVQVGQFEKLALCNEVISMQLK